METEKEHTSVIGWCPACDEGNLHAITLSGLTNPATLCEECEALWLGDEVPNAEQFWQLSRYIREHGNTPIKRRIPYDDDSCKMEEW